MQWLTAKAATTKAEGAAAAEAVSTAGAGQMLNEAAQLLQVIPPWSVGMPTFLDAERQTQVRGAAVRPV